MKETFLSNCEKSFTIQAIKQNTRLDGRTNHEFRKLKINYGADWGGVWVELGETKVLAQVSSELGEPKATRPNEGILHINVELGSMAAPYFEADRFCDLTVQISRTLERSFKDSRCVDLESLCIISDESVWVLRVDITVLNHAGNLVDCCSIAALCALAHYRRPDVSLIDDDVVIHDEDEKEPIKMVIHHYPVCVTYVTYDNGRLAIADPTVLEELTSESQMIFGINSYQELCCLNLGGSTLTSANLLLQCSKRAAKHAKSVVDMIKQSLEKDLELREENKKVGFADCVAKDRVILIHEERLSLKLRNFTFNNDTLSNHLNNSTPNTVMDTNDDTKSNLVPTNFENDSKSTWIPADIGSDDQYKATLMNMTSTDDSSTSEDEIVDKIVEETIESIPSFCVKQPISKQKQDFTSSSDSEEEETIML